MARKSKQYNFYVNHEDEKDLYDYLESFPKMVRSSFIKQLILASLGKGVPYPLPTPIKSNTLEAQAFEIDIDDI